MAIGLQHLDVNVLTDEFCVPPNSDQFSMLPTSDQFSSAPRLDLVSIPPMLDLFSVPPKLCRFSVLSRSEDWWCRCQFSGVVPLPNRCNSSFKRYANSIIKHELLLLFQGVQTDAQGHIKVDEYQNTSVSNIYALGDVCGKALLTPGKAILERIHLLC